MKKITVFAFLLALAIGASAQSVLTVGPRAHNGVGPSAIPGPSARNATVNVPPNAKVPPVAVKGKGGKK